MSKLKRQQSKLNKSMPQQWQFIAMLLPFLIVFIVFTVLPIIGSIGISFTSYDTLSNPQFVGIENYKRMFLSDGVFSTVVKNTFIFAVVSGPLGFLLSFILAWFVNDFKPMVRTLLSFMFYAPSLVGNAYFIWKVMFSGDTYGYINNILISIGIITEPIVWLKNQEYIMAIVIIVQLWQSMGVSFLANISGLQNASRDLYEAGAIDGIRNRWQELRYITLPSMKHMLLFSAVMQIQSSFSAGAIATELAGYPSVRYSADMIVSYMSDIGATRFEMGYASAIAVVLFLMIVMARIIVGKILNMVSR